MTGTISAIPGKKPKPLDALRRRLSRWIWNDRTVVVPQGCTLTIGDVPINADSIVIEAGAKLVFSDRFGDVSLAAGPKGEHVMAMGEHPSYHGTTYLDSVPPDGPTPPAAGPGWAQWRCYCDDSPPFAGQCWYCFRRFTPKPPEDKKT